MNEVISIPTPEHSTLEFELAGFGSRFAAQFIDLLLLVGIVAALTGVAALAGLLDLSALAGDSAATANTWAVALLVLVIFGLVWGYFVLFEWLLRGSTPGKKELGIRVIREDGLPIGFREAALRNLLRAADALPPPVYILGTIVMHLDSRGRRLGDLVAGTLVVRQKFEHLAETATGAAWAARVERGHSRQAITLPGGSLTPRQLDLIEQFLSRRLQLSPERRSALAWQITAPLLHLKSEDKPHWQTQPDRTERSERFLLELVELAREHSARPVAKPPVASPAKPLF